MNTKSAKIEFVIDTDEIQRDTLEKLKGQYQAAMKDAMKKRLDNLFAGYHEVQRQHQYAAKNNWYKLDPDLGLANRIIHDTIDKQIIGDDWENHIVKFTEQNFQKYLDEALEKALRHKANQIAFGKIKGN